MMKRTVNKPVLKNEHIQVM